MQACTCGQGFAVSVSWQDKLGEAACACPEVCFGEREADAKVAAEKKQARTVERAFRVASAARAARVAEGTRVIAKPRARTADLVGTGFVMLAGGTALVSAFVQALM